MSTTFSPNGTTRPPQADEQDWAAWLDYAADQHRWQRDQRTPCQNADCAQLTDALFCSEACREQAEGPDHDDALESEWPATTAETSKTDRGTAGPVEGRNGGAAFPLPEAPASATVRLTIAGYADVLFTLRDSDETRLLRRLETLLQRFPVAAPAAPQRHGKDWCPVHHAPMKENHGNDGSVWYSHKTAEGWCKGKGVRNG